ncbi:hypothetical protein [Actinomadura macrotermitis]|uniref:hypothetical protein n=1 Tax=Actinomadura macrotermitis TaxID=2585200 RepID=UPI001296B8C2|nr:hypothetical protein [Actinomadura macrotermitis]
MASDSVVGAIRALLRSRAVHRLLVLAGIVTAGWLLGGAAHAAHADGPPVPDASRVTAGVPMVGGTLRAVGDGASRAVHDGAVRAVQDGASRAVRAVRPAVSPPVRDGAGRPGAGRNARRPEPRPGASWTSRRPAERALGGPAVRAAHHRPAATGASKATRTRPVPAAARASAQPAQTPPVPVPAPAQAGSLSPVTGPVPLGGITGPPARGPWAPTRPAGVLLRASGAVPPAVRTAADEPSFAPD